MPAATFQRCGAEVSRYLPATIRLGKPGRDSFELMLKMAVVEFAGDDVSKYRESQIQPTNGLAVCSSMLRELGNRGPKIFLDNLFVALAEAELRHAEQSAEECSVGRWGIRRFQKLENFVAVFREQIAVRQDSVSSSG